MEKNFFDIRALSQCIYRINFQNTYTSTKNITSYTFVACYFKVVEILECILNEGNIIMSNISEDGLHLSHPGKVLLSKYVMILNIFLWNTYHPPRTLLHIPLIFNVSFRLGWSRNFPKIQEKYHRRQNYQSYGKIALNVSGLFCD